MSVYNSARVQKALGANIPKEKKDSGRKADPKIEDIFVISYNSAEIYEATDKDTNASDPYCRVGKVKKEGVFSKKWVSESSVKEKTLSPRWSEEDEFILNKKITQLVIEVWDKDTLKDDYIGRAVFDISKVSSITQSLTLDLFKDDNKEKKVGVVNFTIKKLNLTGFGF